MALTVETTSTPPGAMQPPQHREVVDRARRCASTDQSVTTSNPPAATSATSCGDPCHARSPRRCASLTASGAEIDATRVEAALAGDFEEQPDPTSVVEQPAPRPVGEQPAERIEREPVVVLTLLRVGAGEEPRVAAAAVQVADPFRADARVPVQHSAGRAAHDAVAPPAWLPGTEERLNPALSAQRARHQLLRLGDLDLRGVLVTLEDGPSPKHPRPPQLEGPRHSRERIRAERRPARDHPHAFDQQRAARLLEKDTSSARHGSPVWRSTP